MDFGIIIAIAVVAALLWGAVTLVRLMLKSETVFEYQSGLRFTNGKLTETLGPGRYSTFWPGTEIVVEDLREQLMIIPGQEMLTADNLAVKVSLSLRHKTTDARRKALSATDTDDLIYNAVQIALRQAVAARTLEDVLQQRGALATELLEPAVATAAELGVAITGLEVRDIMLTGEAKRAYADIFRSRKDGEAALERARGETAALRNLANGARLLKDNPALFNMRVLQSLTTSAAKGATVVVNVSGETAAPVSQATSQAASPAPGTPNDAANPNSD